MDVGGGRHPDLQALLRPACGGQDAKGGRCGEPGEFDTNLALRIKTAASTVKASMARLSMPRASPTGNGDTVAAAPRQINTLKMFEPTTLPMAMSA